VKIIALEESFWYEKLATEGSTVSHVRVKGAVAAEWQRKLVDFTEYRLPDMDRNGVDMQVLSLNSPGIQVQPDPDIAVADAHIANDFLADIIKEHPQRFAGLAAIPLQDPPKAAAELRRAIELGLCGALVNDHTLGHYLDEPQYAGFWETLQDLDVPLYIHPSAVAADNWKVVQGYPAMDRDVELGPTDRRTCDAADPRRRLRPLPERPGHPGPHGRIPSLPALQAGFPLRGPRFRAPAGKAAFGVLQDQHRDHYHWRVLPRGAGRRDPGSRGQLPSGGLRTAGRGGRCADAPTRADGIGCFF